MLFIAFFLFTRLSLFARVPYKTRSIFTSIKKKRLQTNDRLTLTLYYAVTYFMCFHPKSSYLMLIHRLSTVFSRKPSNATTNIRKIDSIIRCKKQFVQTPCDILHQFAYKYNGRELLLFVNSDKNRKEKTPRFIPREYAWGLRETWYFIGFTQTTRPPPLNIRYNKYVRVILNKFKYGNSPEKNTYARTQF